MNFKSVLNLGLHLLIFVNFDTLSHEFSIYRYSFN